jgi:hypothetical protein
MLGVPDGWSKREGLHDFAEIAQALEHEQISNCKIVLIAVSSGQEESSSEHGVLSFDRTQAYRRVS